MSTPKTFKWPKSDHYDGKIFFNPETGPISKGVAEILRWQWTRQRVDWPKWIENKAKPEIASVVAPGSAQITFINHITFLLQFAGLNMITDPVFSMRTSPFQWAGPKRVRPPGVSLDQLRDIGVILLSHNHYDHLDTASLRRLIDDHNPLIITPLGNADLLPTGAKVLELDWWESHTLHSGEVITLVPAQHWSARGMRDRNKALWGGFFVQAKGKTLYFAGDTGYTKSFREIRERLGAPDISLLPIGAYEPRWFMKDQHMNPEDAVQAHLDLGSKNSLGCHFGCFQLTDEGIDQPAEALRSALEKMKVPAHEFRAPDTGETFKF